MTVILQVCDLKIKGFLVLLFKEGRFTGLPKKDLLLSLYKKLINRPFLASSLEANLKKGTQRTLALGSMLLIAGRRERGCYCEAGKLQA